MGCFFTFWLYSINTWRPRQNSRHFPDDIFKWIFVNENGTNQATSYYLNQLWPMLPTHIYVTMSWYNGILHFQTPPDLQVYPKHPTLFYLNQSKAYVKDPFDNKNLWSPFWHFCDYKSASTGSDNGLVPYRHQAIIWTSTYRQQAIIWTSNGILYRCIYLSPNLEDPVAWRLRALSRRLPPTQHKNTHPP